MPDIAMCNQPCPVRFDCYRSEASGTKPNNYQSYEAYTPPPKDEPEQCGGYWSVTKQRDNRSKQNEER